MIRDKMVGPTLYDPLDRKKIGRNQRFIIKFQDIITNVSAERENVFLQYEDGTIVWCNVALDDEDSDKLFIYPSVLLIPTENEKYPKRITLYISGIKYKLGEEENTLDEMYWTFIVDDIIIEYPNDPLAHLYNQQSTDIDISDTPFTLIGSNPGSGSPNIPINKKIIFVFNKDIDPDQDFNEIIEIENQYVLT